MQKVSPEQMNFVNKRINDFMQMNDQFTELLSTVKTYVKKQKITVQVTRHTNISWGWANSGIGTQLDDVAYVNFSSDTKIPLPTSITNKFKAFEQEKARRKALAESVREQIVFSDAVDILKLLKTLK